MSETSTTKPRTTAKKATSFRGVRAILWNPENDYRLGNMKVPDGCEMVRKYAFSRLSAEKSQASRDSAERTLGEGATFTPAFNLFMLEPGLNWIEASEWEAALNASNERYKADLAESTRTANNQSPVDEIQQLLDDRAIVVYEPSSKVNESRQFTGSLEDYPLTEIRKFAVEINDPKALKSFIEGVRDFDMQQVLKNRLDSVELGF